MASSADAPHLSRRALLRLAGLGALLAACTPPQELSRLVSQASVGPTAAPTLPPTATPTLTSTATATPVPSATETHTPTPTPTSSPTSTPPPTSTPTATPTRGPLRVVSLIHGPARALVVDGVLQRFGIEGDSVRVDLDQAVPDLRAYDAVIFAGGEHGPDQFELPFFQEERKQVLAALEADVPILGICLGHQLLAHWLGGKVEKGRWEVGWLPVTLNEAGRQDPLFAGLGDSFYAFLWHGDRITRLPPDAVLLASSAACPVQAYRLVGRRVWGVQFNPQYDPVIAEGVLRAAATLQKNPARLEELVATGYREYDDLAGRLFGNFFQAVVAG